MDNIYFILLLILIRETHALLLMGQSTSMLSALYYSRKAENSILKSIKKYQREQEGGARN